MCGFFFFFQVFCVDEFLTCLFTLYMKLYWNYKLSFMYVFTINSIKKKEAIRLKFCCNITSLRFHLVHLVPSQYKECRGRKPVHNLLSKKFWKQNLLLNVKPDQNWCLHFTLNWDYTVFCRNTELLLRSCHRLCWGCYMIQSLYIYTRHTSLHKVWMALNCKYTCRLEFG